MPQTIKLRGAVLLKVVGIIMIILGAISVGSGFISMWSGSTMASMFGLDEYATKYFQMIGIISIATGAVELIIGIFGVRFGNRAEKIHFLFICGIVQLVVTAFSTLYNSTVAPMGLRVYNEIIAATEQMYGSMPGIANLNTTNVSGSPALNIVGFVLPVLFIIGVLLNKLPPAQIGSVVAVAPQADAYYEPQPDANLYSQPPAPEEGLYTQPPPFGADPYAPQPEEVPAEAQEPDTQ